MCPLTPHPFADVYFVTIIMFPDFGILCSFEHWPHNAINDQDLYLVSFYIARVRHAVYMPIVYIRVCNFVSNVKVDPILHSLVCFLILPTIHVITCELHFI
jgi:hypothetical protein